MDKSTVERLIIASQNRVAEMRSQRREQIERQIALAVVQLRLANMLSSLEEDKAHGSRSRKELAP